ncbi:MAG: hydroxyacid dehydrogenase [Puniceicoccaceae bacterium]
MSFKEFAGLPKGAIIVGPGIEDLVFPTKVRDELNRICEIVVNRQGEEYLDASAEQLKEVEFLFLSWGSPQLNGEVLAYLPKLRGVFYAAGSLKGIVTEAFWETGIPICSAWGANAVPVAEFTFAQIILSLKQVSLLPQLLRDNQRFAHPPGFNAGGTYGTTVGLVSLGQIGKRVASWLRGIEVTVIAYDPFCSKEAAEELGVTLVGLNEVFERSRVVSLHTPWLPETEGMIGRNEFERMPLGGTFINTSRGAVVREIDLIEVFSERSDLTALLDVTWPEPPVEGSPLYTLPNVFLTPHIAGSIHGECGRLGAYMVEECARIQRGEQLRWSVSRELAATMA